jgi:hypothetical protein
MNLCRLVANGYDVTHQRDYHDGKERGCANKKTLSAYHFYSLFLGFCIARCFFCKVKSFSQIQQFSANLSPFQGAFLCTFFVYNSLITSPAAEALC